ncbi:helix-turn-helix domain-containing protein [Azospirillum agricola]|uniref:helix-turn-helix domain-containing protein n=1 Tax=Azospirillum agricola TaxID=1720247 RepID=UPI001177B031|nr:helix-turn-helix domain-containing protein [Azospirillum agricola]
MTTDTQIRAARAMLQITIAELAHYAEVAPNTILRIEKGQGVNSSTLKSVTRTLEEFGITFIDDNGVLKKKGSMDYGIWKTRVKKGIWYLSHGLWDFDEKTKKEIAAFVVDDLTRSARYYHTQDEIGYIDKNYIKELQSTAEEIISKRSQLPSEKSEKPPNE